MSQPNLHAFFVSAAGRGAEIEIWIDHPVQDFCLQRGICLEAGDDYLIMGPKDAPGRIGIPFDAIRWFRALDQQ